MKKGKVYFNLASIEICSKDIINLKVNNSACGFTDAVIEEAKKDDKIILVGLEDIMEL